MDMGGVQKFSIGKVALSDAARISYEEARAHDSIWAHAAERLGVDNSPDGILDYMAGYFAQDGQLYGMRKPSTRVEAIDRRQAMHGTFREGAKYLYLRDQSGTEFSDLRVSSRRRIVSKPARAISPMRSALVRLSITFSASASRISRVMSTICWRMRRACCNRCLVCV